MNPKHLYIEGLFFAAEEKLQLEQQRSLVAKCKQILAQAKDSPGWAVSHAPRGVVLVPLLSTDSGLHLGVDVEDSKRRPSQLATEQMRLGGECGMSAIARWSAKEATVKAFRDKVGRLTFAAIDWRAHADGGFAQGTGWKYMPGYRFDLDQPSLGGQVISLVTACKSRADLQLRSCRALPDFSTKYSGNLWQLQWQVHFYEF